MTRKVMFVELSISDNTLPLVSGYLEAYACQDNEIAKTYEFEHYSRAANNAHDMLLPDLLKSDSDIYAFSCYVWNMGLIRRILPTLMAEKPQVQIILGGPQVMHHAYKYLDPTHENLVLCNGEGEKTFYEYLVALLDSELGVQPDFSQIGGLSYYRDDTLITNTEHERIRNLDEIPSPFLNDIFKGEYSFAVYETNRGCPFHCAFCYWGAATNDRVVKFSEDRIREEVEWLGRTGVFYVFLADANWGMLRRDVSLSQHIANTSKKYRSPIMIYYSAAKNKPDKVTEITDIFNKAGIIASQPVSLQTMSNESLIQINRQNIKLSAYASVQENLNDRAVSSFTELIWPLPGETLDTFKAGIDNLCAAKAGTIIAYPHLLLHNTPLYNRREEFGLITKVIDEGVGEQEIVVETNDVDFQTYQTGIRFYFAAYILHNMHTLSATANYLHQQAEISYSKLFSVFSDYLLQRQASPLAQYFKQTAEEDDYYSWLGQLAHFTIHVHREHFGELLFDFASKQCWWNDTKVRVLFEIDLLLQPYFYSNTPFLMPSYKFDFVNVIETTERGYLVILPQEHKCLIEEFIPEPVTDALNSNVIHIDHLRVQMPFIKDRGIEHNADYCHGVMMRQHAVLPELKEWHSDSILT